VGLFDYFARKREERLKKLKDELRAELIEELKQTFEKDIRSARKFFGEIRDGFVLSVDDKKSGLEARVKAFEGEVSSRIGGVEEKTQEQYSMTKDAAMRAKKAEESAVSAQRSADEAKKQAVRSDDIAKRANDAYAAIDAHAKKVFDDLSAKAGELLGEKSEELRDVVCHAMSGARDSLVELYKAEYERILTELKDEKKKMLDGYHERMNALERKESSIASAEQRILDMFKYLKDNLPHIAYVVSLPKMEQQLLRDLDKVYHGRADRMMADLEAKSVQTRAKKNLSFEELFIVQAPASLKRLVDYQKEHKVQLSLVLAKVDSWHYARPA
jgi:hypothetical protein